MRRSLSLAAAAALLPLLLAFEASAQELAKPPLPSPGLPKTGTTVPEARNDRVDGPQAKVGQVFATPGSAQKPRVFELRTYVPMPGKAEVMHKRFREHTCALFQSHGMELVGFWTPREGPDKDKLIYMLAFPSKEAADASWKAFHDDPEWIKVRAESEKDGKVVAKAESIYLVPTDYSPMK